ncbi:dephospho-CoA kinase [Chloroflexota bacterium]
MKIIGLTGGIGSGKSSVAQFLAELGAVILDTDRVGHEALEQDTEAWQEVVAVFGRQILTPVGEVDRKKLGDLVFSNPEALVRLNQIVHPRIGEVVQAQLEEYRRQGVSVVVLEVPLLVETSGMAMVNQIWVTVASEPVVLSRLEARSGLSRQQSLARICSQISNEERVKHADVIIHNDGTLDELKDRVVELWQGLPFDTSR